MEQVEQVEQSGEGGCTSTRNSDVHDSERLREEDEQGKKEVGYLQYFLNIAYVYVGGGP